MIVRVRKLKGEGHHDFYDCVECGRRWKSSDKKIGHTQVACARYRKRVYGW